ncbi:tRNA-dihydrouridine synthase [candidate division WOR-3 bacterium]|nr:tRNA-dihydrouridine synthase [candidate division WOR-3 bacterium]
MRIELAPLDGISDRPFRIICRRCGASHVTTEMIPVQGITSNPKKYLQKASFADEERPVTVQIAGSDPSKIRKAVSLVNPLYPDFIELNAGCPARKIIKSCNGAALLKDLTKLRSCAEATVEESKFPVTLKTRIGFDAPIYDEILSALHGIGLVLIKIHGRTALQNYSVKADWETLKYISENSEIPVIGNGDVDSYEKAIFLGSSGSFAGVMIGRAARGNPWIFREKQYSKGERNELIKEHCRLMVEFYGEERGITIMRKHLLWYYKGLKNSKNLKIAASHVSTLQEACKVVDMSENDLFEDRI